tara:strand:- start:42 stop:284 length:243 start_codon:yes stop_codon:yes gene_type:complete
VGLIDKVLEGDLYQSFAKDLSDEDRCVAEENIRIMLSHAEYLHNVLLSNLADGDGIEHFSECLHDLVATQEGLDKWLEKN